MTTKKHPTNTLYLGSDEAGYGPTIGPLVVASIAFQHSGKREDLSNQLIQLGCGDSKKVYAGKNMARLESVALAGLTHLMGWAPSTAEELWQMVGDTNFTESDEPWRGTTLNLPLTTAAIPEWDLPEGMARVAMVHAKQINDLRQQGCNRHEVEAKTLSTQWQDIMTHASGPADALCDRLGGRRHYTELLQETFPQATVQPAETIPNGCLHHLSIDNMQHRWQFRSKADATDGLCGLASCLAKYCREIAMEQFNRYWCGRLRTLKPTAGYPADAKRFRFQLGTGLFSAFSGHFWRWNDDELMNQMTQSSDN